ncbi:MAG: hypothetical protein KGJ78_14125 [Alphaproteobacteria bacterium]|nr:hypothetical protein [Alphaproteobacteria bacterium]
MGRLSCLIMAAAGAKDEGGVCSFADTQSLMTALRNDADTPEFWKAYNND